MYYSNLNDLLPFPKIRYCSGMPERQDKAFLVRKFRKTNSLVKPPHSK